MLFQKRPGRVILTTLPKPPDHFLKLVVAVIAIVLFLIASRRGCPRRPRRSVTAELGVFCVLRSGLLRDVFAGVNPVGIHVDGGGEVVDARLEALSANFAV